jgi:hypothetical protein
VSKKSKSYGNQDSMVDVNVRSKVDSQLDANTEVDNHNRLKNRDYNTNISKIVSSGNAEICLDIDVYSDSTARVRSRAVSDQEQDQNQDQDQD